MSRGLFKKKPVRPFCSAVVAAAGRAVRFGGENKLLCDIGGVPVLGRALLMLNACPDIDEIVIAARSEDILVFSDVVRDFKIHKAAKIIRGGDTRLQSVYQAVRECDPSAQFIAVHDGARPNANPELISRVVRAAIQHSAAAPVIPLHDTVKRVHDGFITATVPRDTLRAVQTPQVFAAKLLHGALYKATQDTPDVTDDCAAVEALGVRVAAVEGSEFNRKVTIPEDLEYLKRLFI
jgi:2-C-methyl-D-erythritol 4-phosphate cytidylyltransferase